jgi:hypothetical protein
VPNTKQMDRVFHFIMDAKRIQCSLKGYLNLDLKPRDGLYGPTNSHKDGNIDGNLDRQ